jgi:segregation and condensation protein A
MDIFRETLARKTDEPEEEPVVERHEVTVEQKVRELDRELRQSGRVSFRRWIASCRTRVEVIVSLMAVLELIKSLALRAEQDRAFGDISLVALAPQPAGQAT